VPASEESGASVDERRALVTLMKWASAPELQLGDIGVVLVTETLSELHGDLTRNPHVASVRIALPDLAARRQFIGSGWFDRPGSDMKLAEATEFSVDDLARRTSGLSLLQVEQLVMTAKRTGEKADLGAAQRRQAPPDRRILPGPRPVQGPASRE
jgi:hypothetical protein